MFFRNKNVSTEVAVEPYLPDVSQPMPLHIAPRDVHVDISVTELSELEARELCAREDIAVFWPRNDSNKRRA